ncbi:hypothetical protein PJ900_01115 (plasmid) [Tistrella mobilis]|nr:hypothetical protein [Tistrella mobilis]
MMSDLLPSRLAIVLEAAGFAAAFTTVARIVVLAALVILHRASAASGN